MSEQNSIHSLIRYVNDAPLESLTAEQLEDWYLWFRDTPTKRTGRKPSQITVLNTVSHVRQVLISAHGEDKVNELFKRIRPVVKNHVVVKEEELLSDDEVRRMLQACSGERDRAIIAVLASAGCRVGELVNLKIKDVTLRRESASLHLDGKTGQRDIDMFVGVPELKAWVSVHPYRDDPESPLFIQKESRGSIYGPLGKQGVSRMLNRVAEKAGIPEIKRTNPHSFRHKRATDLADHMTIADLRYMFGWADMSTTPNIYVHSSRGKVRRKLAEIAGVKVPESVAPTTMVKQCPVCGTLNAATATWCINCTTTLSEPLARAEKTVEEWMLADMRNKKE